MVGEGVVGVSEVPIFVLFGSYWCSVWHFTGVVGR